MNKFFGSVSIWDLQVLNQTWEYFKLGPRWGEQFLYLICSYILEIVVRKRLFNSSKMQNHL